MVVWRKLISGLKLGIHSAENQKLPKKYSHIQIIKTSWLYTLFINLRKADTSI